MCSPRNGASRASAEGRPSSRRRSIAAGLHFNIAHTDGARGHGGVRAQARVGCRRRKAVARAPLARGASAISPPRRSGAACALAAPTLSRGASCSFWTLEGGLSQGHRAPGSPAGWPHDASCSRRAESFRFERADDRGRGALAISASSQSASEHVLGARSVCRARVSMRRLTVTLREFRAAGRTRSSRGQSIRSGTARPALTTWRSRCSR